MMRSITTRGPFGVSLLAALLVVLLTASPAEACQSNADCKGNRVCRSGRCASASTPSPTPRPTPRPTPIPAPTPAPPAATTGWLWLRSQPSGASVELDGKPLATPTPVKIPDLAVGRHRVVLRRGNLRHDGTVVVVAGRMMALTLRLTQAKVTLDVTSTPSGATISIGGRGYGTTPSAVTVYAGKHVVQLDKPGHVTARKTVEVGADAPRQALAFALTKLATVTISSVPAGATIYVDGRHVAKTPQRVELAPGKHGVELRLATYQPVKRTLQLDAGVGRVMSVMLQVTPAERQRLALAKRRYDEAMASYQRDAEPTRGRRRLKNIIGYSAVGLAAACAIGAGVLYGVGFSAGGSAHDIYSTSSDPAQVAVARGDIESARTKVLAGSVLAATAAVAGGIAIWQLVTRPSLLEQPQRKQYFHAGAMVSSSGAGIQVGGTF